VRKVFHIGVFTSLSTEAFLAALRLFIPRRGKSRNIYSDNSTNFQVVANEDYAINKMIQSASQVASVQDI
jgi:hypothetical protein